MSYFRATVAIYWLKDRLRPLRRLLPAGIRKTVYRFFMNRTIARLPSRLFMETSLVRPLSAAGVRTMLFAGVNPYNRQFLETCARAGIDVWTVDPDPSVASDGIPGRHCIGSVAEIDRLLPGQRFDAAILNGIVGFGFNETAEASRCLTTLAMVLSPPGLVVVGWNPPMGADVAQTLRSGLRPTRLGDIPEVVEFPALPPVMPHPHRYEVFRSAFAAT